MKRIGILTFHRSYNYGAFMQCYALANRIRSDFNNVIVEVIDYTTLATMRGYEKSDIAKVDTIQSMIKIRNNNIEVAQSKYLPLSEYKLISDDYLELFKNIKGRYDIIIVGSDAVWNWQNRGFPNAYLLGFDLGAAKMSYAASAHGMDFRKIPEEDKTRLKEYLKLFSYIGVREKTTEEMIRSVDSSLEVCQNCDPTVLLNTESIPVDMKKLREKLESKGVKFDKPIIGLMAGEPYGKMIKKYFRDRVQVVAVYEPNKYADVYLYDLNPLEWSRIFSFFSVTITHFFHGTLLSLINNTPVMPIEISSSYNSQYITKIKNVMDKMELEEYYTVWNRNSTLIKRGLNKYKLNNDRAFWRGICIRIEEILKDPPKERIRLAIEKDAKNYNGFKKSLEEILGEE